MINPKLETGFSGSGFTYQGDLSDNLLGNVKDVRYGLGIFGRYYISPTLAVRANYYRGSMRGNDTEFTEEWRQKRAYKFSSTLSELSLMIEADFFGPGRFRSLRDFRRHSDRFGFSFFAGAGVVFTDPKRNWSGLDRGYFYRDAPENIPQDSMNAPSRKVIVLPVGVNMHYDITKQISIFCEAGYRFTFTDNLDGYKYSVFSSRHDGYSVYSLGASFRFDSKRYYPTGRFRSYAGNR